MMTETEDLTVERLGVIRVGGLSAILYVVVVVAAVALFSSTGLLEAADAAEALPIWAEQPTTTAIAGVLFVVAAIALAVAGLGIYVALRRAGSFTAFGLLAFVGGGLLALVRNVFWLAVGNELAPAYTGSAGEVREVLAIVGDTLLGFGTIIGDQVGGVLVGGVAVPIMAFAMRRVGLGSRWLAWLGFVVAVLAGWFTLLVSASSVFEQLSFLGFVAFLIWMVAVGWILLRSRAGALKGSPI